MTHDATARTAARLLLTAVILFTPGCSGGPAQNDEDETRPRAIVLITVDALVTDDLALFGGAHPAPALQKLADGGAIWRDGWTVNPMTRPAVATYLTGVAPDRHGVRDDLFTALPSTIPTLATLLSDRGYRTAAFPNSSFLGFGSGLLDGFEVVDEPEPIPVHPGRWIPQVRGSGDTAGNAATWLGSLPADTDSFVWIHFAETLVAHLTAASLVREEDSGEVRRDEKAREEAIRAAIEGLDATVTAVVGALEARGELDRAAIIVAGVSGDPTGDASEIRGPGFSLHERAIRVPVLARFPAGWELPADSADRVVWAPDVAATVAGLGGVALSPDAEGVSLLRPMDDDRMIFAWSWALRDQMGWKRLRAARTVKTKRLEGFDETTFNLDGSDDPVDPVEAERLASGLAGRASPEAPSVPLATIQGLLAEHDLSLEAIPDEGRAFGTPEECVRLGLLLWGGRWLTRRDAIPAALKRYNVALGIDPDNLGALLDRGQILAISQHDDARPLLARAVTRYPTDPEIVHWYAHAIWRDSVTDAERLLDAILPYKPNDADVLYDLACTHSLSGDLAAAEEFLRSAIRAGFRSWAHMDTDADLRNLRESGRFAVVMREVRQ